MRVPKVANCKTVAVVAVGMMIAGTVIDSAPLRAWAVLIGLFSSGMFIGAAIKDGVEAVKGHLTRYMFEVFEDGFRGGLEQGREIEAAERFIASTARTTPPIQDRNRGAL